MAMSVLAVPAGGTGVGSYSFHHMAAAGAGGDDGERRPPVGPLGKQGRSTHEEDNTEATGYLPWQRRVFACESCRLAFDSMAELVAHLAPSPDRIGRDGFGYYIFVTMLGRAREIYLVDDGVAVRPPAPLPGRVYHSPELNPDPAVAMRAIRRYSLRNGRPLIPSTRTEVVNK